MAGIARARARLRDLLAGNTCTPAAPIFDPLSARIAQALGWEVCKLSGSVWKAANLGFPDDVSLANVSDLADICRRIRRLAPDLSLSVDADDAGGTTLTVLRAVRELEAAGVSAVEIEDTKVPERFVRTGSMRADGVTVSRHAQLNPLEVQVANLKAAVAARDDPLTVIIARTSALNELAIGDALQRVRAYSATGADALMLPGMPPRGRADIEAIRTVSDLPLCVLGLPDDAVADERFLTVNRIRIRYLGQPVYQMAVRAIYDGLKHLQAGGSAAALKDRIASPDILQLVNRRSEFAEFERSHDVQESTI